MRAIHAVGLAVDRHRQNLVLRGIGHALLHGDLRTCGVELTVLCGAPAQKAVARLIGVRQRILRARIDRADKALMIDIASDVEGADRIVTLAVVVQHNALSAVALPYGVEVLCKGIIIKHKIFTGLCGIVDLGGVGRFRPTEQQLSVVCEDRGVIAESEPEIFCLNHICVLPVRRAAVSVQRQRLGADFVGNILLTGIAVHFDSVVRI